MNARLIAGSLAAIPIMAFLATACDESIGTGPDPTGSAGDQRLVDTIWVAATTTGISRDADGYTVTLDEEQDAAIGPAGSAVFGGVAPGEHEVRLEGLASNCAVARGNPRTVTIEVGRRVSITFDVHCSSGLGTIAFVRSGADRQAIWVVDVEGGGAVRVSDPSGGDADFDPAWSPDGARIAFTRGRPRFGTREVWIMDADGANPRQLTPDITQDSRPAWSPDGSRIAFMTSREGASEIFAMDPDGSDPVNLTNDPRKSDGSPTWSPDGARIAFTRCCPLSVYAIDLRGGSPVRLSYPTDGDDGDFRPAWSPDGTRIAFDRGDFFSWTPHDIWVMDADGGNPRDLTNSGADDVAPAWSPDGTRIVYASHSDGESDIYVMDADGGNPRALMDGPTDDFDPTWSR